MASLPTLRDGIALTHFTVAADIERATRVEQWASIPLSKRSGRYPGMGPGSGLCSVGPRPYMGQHYGRLPRVALTAEIAPLPAEDSGHRARLS
jgi:hypothetical protein